MGLILLVTQTLWIWS